MSQDFRKWLLIHGGIIAGTVLILGGALWYMRSDISSRIEAIRSKELQIALRLRASGLLAALKREREEAKPFEPKLQSFLPPRDQLIAFSRDLERLARARSVGLGFGFGAETPATQDAAGTIGFTITVGGTPANILAYLEDIERSAFIIRIENVDLSGSGSIYSLASDGKVFFR